MQDDEPIRFVKQSFFSGDNLIIEEEITQFRCTISVLLVHKDCPCPSRSQPANVQGAVGHRTISFINIFFILFRRGLGVR